MKSYLPLLSLAVIFASCTSAYKSGQTPDDVYFSPARPQDEYVRVDENDDRQYRGDEEYRDDRYLRMKVHNRTRWSMIDDGYYYNYYPSYSYAYYNGWNAPVYWNYLYNPYCCCNTTIVSYKSPVYNKPRMMNLRVFDNVPVTTNPKAATYSSKTYSTRTSSNNNRSKGSSGAGSILRNVFFGGSESSSNKSNSGSGYGTYNTRTSSSSSSSNSSSSSSGSGSSNSSRGNATRGRN